MKTYQALEAWEAEGAGGTSSLNSLQKQIGLAHSLTDGIAERYNSLSYLENDQKAGETGRIFDRSQLKRSPTTGT